MRDGHSLAAHLTSAFAAATLEFPPLPPSVCLYQALKNWHAARGSFPAGLNELSELAGVLETALDHSGWMLRDLAAGHVRAFACSEIDSIIDDVAGERLI